MNGCDGLRPERLEIDTRLPRRWPRAERHRGISMLRFFLAAVLAAAALVAAPARHMTAQDGPAATFAVVYSRWNAANLELEQLGEELNNAPADRRAAVRAALLERFGALKGMVAELREAALAAYRAEPNQSAEVIEVLLRLAATDLQEDRVGRGVEIIGLLLDNRAVARGVLDLAGRAAYMQDDFVNAKEFWRQAQEENAISEGSQGLATEIDQRVREFDEEKRIREREAAADDLPIVRLETSKGNLTIVLYEDQAPNAVANFISLIESGYYDGLTFHRVLSGFMAQGGCNIGDGTGGPGYEIACECVRADFRRHFRGTLSMAHAGKDTGGSQFFLTFQATPHLDGRHTAFGRVVEGLEVLSELQRIQPMRSSEGQPDRILRATVVRKRNHAYVVTKIE